ncbi:MAG: zinc metallopeptidase [Dehalococcoidia bacterium]|nr:zinc metallopeptidase [Dehalococcoidia bacterium]
MYFGNYGLYILISIPALILGLYAQAKVQGAFRKYSQVQISNGLTGAQVARKVLDANNLQNVRIEPIRGSFSDHYDPRKRILRLSQPVYGRSSIAAAGVAAHEAGHAIQHKKHYGPLALRSLMVPSVQIGSWLGPIVFMIGFFMASDQLALIGLALFAGTALFAIVTIPVELDASKRAKQVLHSTGLVHGSELQGVDKVLDAAALTYVAGAVQALSTLLYYGMLFFGGRRRRS